MYVYRFFDISEYRTFDKYHISKQRNFVYIEISKEKKRFIVLKEFFALLPSRETPPPRLCVFVFLC